MNINVYCRYLILSINDEEKRAVEVTDGQRPLWIVAPPRFRIFPYDHDIMAAVVVGNRKLIYIYILLFMIGRECLPLFCSALSKSFRRLHVSPRKYAPVPLRTDAATHLDGVEDAVNAAISYYQSQISTNNTPLHAHSTILSFPPDVRETIGVASKLRKRLDSLARNGDCRRCWLQKRHCICGSCPPLEEEDSSSLGGIENVNRLFMLVSENVKTT